MDNKINYQIPEEVVTQVLEKLSEAETLLKPYLIALTTDERKGLPKMSDGTSPFVYKCIDYCENDPQFAPPYMDIDEFKNDMKVWEQLMSIFRPVLQLQENLDDTVMEAGAESYVSALSYYNAVKLAARSSVPGAKSIYDDLKKRFAQNGNRK